MAQITITQSVNDSAGGNASLSGVTAGRVLVYVVNAGRYFGATPDVTSVSGGTGTTWTRRTNASAAETGTFIFVGTGNTATTVTMSCSGSFDEIVSTLYELDANASDFDVAAQATGSGSALSSGATATLDSADDLAIGGGMRDTNFTSFTPGGGFTEDDDQAPAGYACTASHLEVTSTSGVTASYTATSSGVWTAAVVTIKIAAAGAAASSYSGNMSMRIRPRRLMQW